jgi:hypothetical protein
MIPNRFRSLADFFAWLKRLPLLAALGSLGGLRRAEDTGIAALPAAGRGPPPAASEPVAESAARLPAVAGIEVA